MITIKTPEEIAILKQAGKILSSILDEVISLVRPGVKTIELDALAEKLIYENGCEPSFKNYQTYASEPKYPTTLCTSVNNEVVHTPASSRELTVGDIIGVDVGLKKKVNGRYYFVDMAKTVPVGYIDKSFKKLIKVARTALEKGINQIKPGNHIHDISRAIQTFVEEHGFSVVRQLVGHGVGYQIHEAPRIPNYFDKNEKPIEMKPGMVLAIEPMVNIGGYKVKTLADGWTIVTVDGSRSAHFEHTVAVTDDGREILTK